MNNTVKTMGYEVFASSLNDVDFQSKQVVINTINAYSYVVAKKDYAFNSALKESEILVPDGFPVVLAAKLLKSKKITKIAGADVFFHFCRLANETNRKVFFLGSSDNTLEKISSKIKIDFPNLRAGFFSPPFKAKFNDAENTEMIEKVNQFEPDILFIGMTAPKQEKWVNEHKRKLNTRLIGSIGAVFDFYAGTVSRPSEFWIKLNLEWLIRLLKEPKRLWKRYLIYSPIFIFDMILFKLRIKK